MSEFDRAAPGFRFAEIYFGETIQQVAARELGDARRWHELVAINNLVPPYFTGDPAQAGERVLLYGSVIIIPAPVPVVSSSINPSQVFGTDMLLEGGQLTDDGQGDFALIDGKENLVQSLRHLIMTDKGELIFHGGYGCAVQRVIGTMNNATAGLLAREYVAAALRADSRVQEVANTRFEIKGDQLLISVDVIPVTGLPFPLAATITVNGVVI